MRETNKYKIGGFEKALEQWRASSRNSSSDERREEKRREEKRREERRETNHNQPTTTERDECVCVVCVYYSVRLLGTTRYKYEVQVRGTRIWYDSMHGLCTCTST